MKKWNKIIGRVLKYGCLISTLALIGTVLLQIFARFLLESAPSWTEEASRILFIYAISFASGLAMEQDYYVQLDVFYRKLSPKTQRTLDLFIPIFIVLMFGLFTFFSVQFIQLGHVEKSPSMAIPMSVAFFSMFIMGASITYFAYLDGRKAFKKLRA
ncbi:MAG: TRAP transporter small permease [Bacteroidota bacterium]